MCGQGDRAAALEMVHDQCIDQCAAFIVQAGVGLIEQPDPALADQQAGQSQAPGLTGRQRRGQAQAESGQSNARQRLIGSDSAPAVEGLDEPEVLAAAQGGLEAGSMAKEGAALSAGQLALDWPYHPGQAAKQGGLAAAVRTENQQQPSCVKTKADVIEHRLSPSIEAQRMGFQKTGIGAGKR